MTASSRPGARSSSASPIAVTAPPGIALAAVPWDAPGVTRSGLERSARPCATRRSDVKVADLPRLGLDEVLPRRDLLAHQHREDRVRGDGVVDLGAEERPRLGVHRRLPELLGVHLA